MSQPPTIPPDIAGSVSPDWPAFWAVLFEQVKEWYPFIVESGKDPAAGFVAEIAAAVVEFAIQVTSEVGRRVGESVDEFEATAGPTIMRAAAAAMSDYFGVPISTSDISRAGGPGSKFAFHEQLGRFVLESFFGAFEVPQGLTPDVGRENAERILGFNIGTSLEAWLGNVVGQAPLLKFIPNWADLDEILTRALGLGRVTRRIMGPLLTTLVATPFQWDLNRRFTPELLSESDLVRARMRRLIDDGEYFETMSLHGWNQRDAQRIRLIRQRYPEKEDLAKMLELGLITEERAAAVYEALGFSAEGAQSMVDVTVEDRIRTHNNALESLARDMFRDHQIEESELRALLAEAGRSERESQTLVGIALVERDRPRPLPRSIVEEGFRKGLIPLSRLRDYYEQQGYGLDDRVLLEELAVEDREEQQKRDEDARRKSQTDEFRAVPRGQIERAFVEGFVSSARLREYYESRNYAPADIGTLMELAERRKVEYDERRDEELKRAQDPDFRAVPRATMEEAYIRGLITEGRLRDYYLAIRLDPEEVPVVLAVVKARKAEREATTAERLQEATGPDFRELPRSVIERAFLEDIIDLHRLTLWYQAQAYRPSEIPILVQLAVTKKAAQQAKAAGG